MLDPAQKEKWLKNHLAPILQKPFNIKNAQICQMYLFSTNPFNYEKVFWACWQKDIFTW